MATIINHQLSGTYQITTRPSLFTTFFNWCENQQKNRLLWLAIALAGHGCILTPVTVIFVLFAGANLTLFMAALIAMALSLVTNLAAMPTKVTIPVFFLSVLIDITVII